MFNNFLIIARDNLLLDSVQKHIYKSETFAQHIQHLFMK